MKTSLFILFMLALFLVACSAPSQNIVYKDENGTVITKEQFDAITNASVPAPTPTPPVPAPAPVPVVNITPVLNVTQNVTQNWTLNNATNATTLNASASFNISLKAKCTWALPDPDFTCTPGNVTNVTITQLCTPGYTSTVRNVSDTIKEKVYANYGVTNRTTGEYEIDHFIPLALAGSNDITNLWPEPATPLPGFRQKDVAEVRLYKLVCNGSMNLSRAQNEIRYNWQAYTG